MPEAAWGRHEPPVPPPARHGGEGFVLLVDGARYLPDNVVACGVYAALLDSQGGALCEASAPCLSASPDVRSPRFHLRLELRPEP